MLIIAALDDFVVKSANILNACDEVPVIEEMWTSLGHEFGSDVIKTAVIVRVLCGLKWSAAAFRSNLTSCIEFLWYLSCWADLHLWMKPKPHPDNKINNYLYLLCCMDGILCIQHSVDSVLHYLH